MKPEDLGTRTEKFVGFSDGLWSGGSFSSRKGTMQASAMDVLERFGDDFIEGRDGISRILVTDFEAARAGVFMRNPGGEGWLLVRVDTKEGCWAHPLLTQFGAWNEEPHRE